MPMKMTFRWYGEGNDRIKLSDIKQIPGVKGIVWALHDKMPGEIWSEEEIAKMALAEESGLVARKCASFLVLEKGVFSKSHFVISLNKFSSVFV